MLNNTQTHELTLSNYKFKYAILVDVTKIVTNAPTLSAVGAYSFFKADVHISTKDTVKDSDTCFATSDISDILSTLGHELSDEQKTDISAAVNSMVEYCRALVISGNMSDMYNKKMKKCWYRLIIKAGS